MNITGKNYWILKNRHLKGGKIKEVSLNVGKKCGL